jgi:hypothetical protein
METFRKFYQIENTFPDDDSGKAILSLENWRCQKGDYLLLTILGSESETSIALNVKEAKGLVSSINQWIKL